MWLFILFIAVPLIEIALFIQVGGAIGLWPTLLIVVVTAILGTALVRSQGSQTLARLRESFDDLRDPTEHLAHGAMILFSGALLLTPGFFTDAVGFLLLIPGVRKRLFDEVKKRVHVETVSYGGRADQPGAPRDEDGDIIDGDFTEVDPPRKPTHQPSGWTRH